MCEIIYDFRAISDTLRRPWLDDWWQPTKREIEPQVAEPRFEQKAALTCGLDV